MKDAPATPVIEAAPTVLVTAWGFPDAARVWNGPNAWLAPASEAVLGPPPPQPASAMGMRRKRRAGAFIGVLYKNGVGCSTRVRLSCVRPFGLPSFTSHSTVAPLLHPVECRSCALHGAPPV